MSSVRYEHDHDNGEGRAPTKCFIQEVETPRGTSYVITEHPDNQGRHVSLAGPEIGDSLVLKEMESRRNFKPEQLQLYVERPATERTLDDIPRFAKLQAKTTLEQNTSPDPNNFEYRPAQWRWSDGYRMDQSEAELNVGAVIVTDPRSQDRALDKLGQAMSEVEMPSTWESQQLRNAAQMEQERQGRR